MDLLSPICVSRRPEGRLDEGRLDEGRLDEGRSAFEFQFSAAEQHVVPFDGVRIIRKRTQDRHRHHHHRHRANRRAFLGHESTKAGLHDGRLECIHSVVMRTLQW